ncbi:hypothetical protein [Shewanella surugensis]|uniref:Cytochrome c-552/4 domain-containing protein n=1 Tax=Shewanella surugensis TaxID=212020 RepID=A0ABT0LJH1_9GAMM|nr:hypothetical protein [Shewanella surugensis]MCL1127605.1 hypothetical protein [Shewanella surugensis]
MNNVIKKSSIVTSGLYGVKQKKVTVFLSLIIMLMACGNETENAASNNQVIQTQNILEYGQQCTALIGQIPAFNCNDGTIVPITIDGEEPIIYTHKMECDNPSMLPYSKDTFGQCTPYSRILDLSYDDVQISAFCRREQLRDKDSEFYDEIDIILHSTSNGDTCWFHTEVMAEKNNEKTGIDGKRVPPPNEVTPPKGHVSALDFWWQPKETVTNQCGNCHDADPFMYSPYLGQVWHEVPTDPLGWYNNHVGPDFSKWTVSSAIMPEGNTCTGCHRIGNIDSCPHNVKLENGKVVVRSAILSSAGMQEIEGGNEIASSYPNSHWMPVNNFHSEAFWGTVYKDSVIQLLSCCEDSEQDQCQLTPITGKP